MPLAGRIEGSFARQLETLPDQTRTLVLLAAVDPSGDQVLVWRAAGRLGIPVQQQAGRRRAGDRAADRGNHVEHILAELGFTSRA